MEDVKKERIYKYDNIKCFLILSVVIGHFFNKYVETSNILKVFTFIIYTFHMPAFIFLSGLFSNRQKKINANKIIGYIIIGILIIVIKALLNKGIIELLGGNGWYLLVLAGFMLITYFFRNVSDLNFVMIFTLLALISGYDKTMSTLLLRFFTFMPFYILGLYLNPDKVNNIMKDKKVKMVSIFILTLYCIISYVFIDKIYILRNLFLGKYNYFEAFKNCNFLFRIVTYFLSTIIMFAIFTVIPNKKINIITGVGSKTLAIYFYHIPIYTILNEIGVFEYLKNLTNIKFAIIIYGIMACALTIVLSNKYLCKPIDKLLNTKNKEESVI